MDNIKEFEDSSRACSKWKTFSIGVVFGACIGLIAGFGLWHANIGRFTFHQHNSDMLKFDTVSGNLWVSDGKLLQWLPFATSDHQEKH